MKQEFIDALKVRTHEDMQRCKHGGCGTARTAQTAN